MSIREGGEDIIEQTAIKNVQAAERVKQIKEKEAQKKQIVTQRNKIRELLNQEVRKVYQCPFLPGLQKNLE